MKKQVVIYTQHGCPPCHSAMEFLSRHGVAYEERNVNDDPAAGDELVALGSHSTPTIKVGERVMVGFRSSELLSWLEE